MLKACRVCRTVVLHLVESRSVEKTSVLGLLLIYVTAVVLGAELVLDCTGECLTLRGRGVPCMCV